VLALTTAPSKPSSSLGVTPVNLYYFSHFTIKVLCFNEKVFCEVRIYFLELERATSTLIVLADREHISNGSIVTQNLRFHCK
jgi:hypothetical protein